MKNKIFMIMLLQILILGLMALNTDVRAYSTESISNMAVASSVTNPADNPDSYKPSDMKNADKVKDKGNKIIGVVQFIGTFVSIFSLIVIGIKYMMGSVEEKAEYKKTMMPYIIGAFMLFGITNLLGILNSITDGLF